MSFYTAINCMDGRVQLPVITYLQKRFGVEHVDSITAAGPNRLVTMTVPAIPSQRRPRPYTPKKPFST